MTTPTKKTTPKKKLFIGIGLAAVVAIGLLSALIFLGRGFNEAATRESVAFVPVELSEQDAPAASPRVLREPLMRPKAKRAVRANRAPAAKLQIGPNAYRPYGSPTTSKRPTEGMMLSRRPQPLPGSDDRFSNIRVLNERRQPKQQMFFQDYGVNPTVATTEQHVSTFAVDVDTASYTMVRSYLDRGMMPAEAAVRVEEMVNAFDYAYEAPTREPFLVQAEVFPSPNRKGYHVLHLGLKGREVNTENRKAVNLVFVIDVSGSMQGPTRLGLVKRSLNLLTQQLDERDSVAIVVYGDSAHTVLAPTRVSGMGKDRILSAIHGLHTQGSTNVQAGLEVGYKTAAENLRRGSVNRVVLCSDGVANTGSTEASEILRRVSREAKRGVTISTVGFGMGNYNDTLMEKLADKGNGNYAYIDDIRAARKHFVENLSGTLQTIAKDVKLQMVFSKSKVERYRLLGFENRQLQAHEFDNDAVDAGEIGAGHTVTAIYEVKFKSENRTGEFGTLKVRYKDPEGSRSKLIARELPMSVVRKSYSQASAPTKLSMVAAGFAEKLRGSYWARNMSYDELLDLWNKIPAGLQSRNDVQELRRLIVAARGMDTRQDRFEELMPIARMDFDRVPVLR